MKWTRTYRAWWIGTIVAAVLIVGVGWFIARDGGITLDPSLAQASVMSCSDVGASGTVHNGADRQATPVVEVAFVSATGETIHSGSVTKPGLMPDETASWFIDFSGASEDGTATVDKCVVSVPTLFKFSP